MRQRHILLGLVLLVSATACQDTPLAPAAAPPAEPALTISGGTTDLRSGYAYSCVLRSGVVTCFGENDEGQPVGVHRAATGRFVQLSTGATHACAVRSDGAVECWGVNDFGRAPPLRRAATGAFTQVSAGLSHTCALRGDGVVECWGSNEYGQSPPLVTSPTGRFSEVMSGATTGCALRSDGAIQCWGRRRFAPELRRAPSGVYVKLGEVLGNTNCAVTSTGVADCWGYQNLWKAGPYTQVGAGGGHICGLRTNGTADCFFGYPGSWVGPHERSILEPLEGSVLARTWSRVSVGSYHTCGLRADGHFECFGVQVIGSDAPDVVPSGDPPTSGPMGTARIRVLWRDVNTNDLRTEIERSVADRDRIATTWAPAGSVGPNRIAFIDSVKPGATYVYRLRVCNNAGCSEWEESNPTAMPVAVPPTPSRVAATSYPCSYATCATLTWAVDNTFVESFRLQIRANGGAWEDLPVQERTSTRFEDWGLTPGTTYQYRIRACNVRGCGYYGASNTFTAPFPPPPPAPASLSVYAMAYYIHLVWGDVADETTYERQRRQREDTGYGEWGETLVRTMNVTSDQDAAPPGGIYQYRIRACNPGGCSGYTLSRDVQN